MKVKKMKKTLVASIMTVVLCVAALVGTTMAWFTHTVSVSADIKAGTFSIALKKYDASSDSYVEIGKKRVNAKSIMGMMTLGLDAGEEITLSANGEDEEAAMNSIENYLSNQ